MLCLVLGELPTPDGAWAACFLKHIRRRCALRAQSCILPTLQEHCAQRSDCGTHHSKYCCQEPACMLHGTACFALGRGSWRGGVRALESLRPENTMHLGQREALSQRNAFGRLSRAQPALSEPKRGGPCAPLPRRGPFAQARWVLLVFACAMCGGLFAERCSCEGPFGPGLVCTHSSKTCRFSCVQSRPSMLAGSAARGRSARSSSCLSTGVPLSSAR